MQARTKKIVVTAVIAGVISIFVIAMLIRSKRKKLEALINSGSPDIVQPAKATVSVSSVAFPLKKGYGKTTAEKNAVRLVQRYINAKSVYNPWLQVGIIDEDGIFGSITEDALVKLTGTSQVSYSKYMEMQSFLIPVPDLLSPEAKPYVNPDNPLLNPLNTFR